MSGSVVSFIEVFKITWVLWGSPKGWGEGGTPLNGGWGESGC